MTKPFREQIAYIINPWVMEPQEGVPFFPDDFPPKANALALADEILALLIPPDLREASELATQGELTTGCKYNGYQSLYVNEREFIRDLWNADARFITLAVNRIRELLA